MQGTKLRERSGAGRELTTKHHHRQQPLTTTNSGPTTFALAPPGSGELLPELRRSGMLGHMQRAGARYVDVNAVDDNLLWRAADPVFIGYLIAQRAGAAAKVVEPEAVARAYAALSAGFPAAADADELVDGAALQAPAIGAYCFTLQSVEALAAAAEGDPLLGLRLAPARGIPKRAAPPPLPALPPNLPPQARAQALAAAARAAEAAGAARPVEGYALQRYLADALRGAAASDIAGGVALLGVERGEEFATLHSRGPHWAVGPAEEGVARLMGLHSAWLEAAGCAVACEEGVEVSPLVSYAGEGLDAVAAARGGDDGDGAGAVFDSPYDAALQGGAGGAAAGRAPHNAGLWAAPLAAAYAAAMVAALAKSAASRARKA